MEKKMIKWSVFIVLSIFVGLAVVFSLNTSKKPTERIRECAVAGSFYPEDPKELATMIDQFLEKAEKHEIPGPLYALVAPHAGYVYSGHVAAHSYTLLKGRGIKRVVVISPSHIESFEGAAIYDGDYYATPLDNVVIDKQFSAKLAEQHDLLTLSEKGHTSQRAGRMEHALEVQLPFLQRVLPDFKLVAIVMGDQSYETCRALGTALSGLIATDQTIIVSSSDLSHFHNYAEAVRLDHKVLNAIKEWDYFNMCRNFQSRIWEACGGGPIVTAMIASERMGANKAKILKYANSGDVPYGDKKSVVGYTAVAFYKSNSVDTNVKTGFKLNKAEQRHLLNIARASVEKAVRNGEKSQCSAGEYQTLTTDRGAFVTLTKNGELRGCIGYTSPLQPLYNTVRDVAAHAALKDPRFSPVETSELDQIHYEISVLSPFRRVTDIKQIAIGQHGLLIKKGRYEGLLLQQVATDYEWDRITFLQQTCRKASLPLDAWENDETDIFMFSAFVFGEE
jgi:AmmeMemoRadiSam system protein B/AmmeMemoRadiSam system protein A